VSRIRRALSIQGRSNDAWTAFYGSKPLKSLEAFNYPTLTAGKLYPSVKV